MLLMRIPQKTSAEPIESWTVSSFPLKRFRIHPAGGMGLSLILLLIYPKSG